MTLTLSEELARRGIKRFRAADADTSGCWHWWRGNCYLGSFDVAEGWKIIATIAI